MYPYDRAWVFEGVPTQLQVVYYQQDTTPVDSHPQTNHNGSRRRRRRNRNGARRHQDNNVAQAEHLEGTASEPHGANEPQDAGSEVQVGVTKQEIEQRDQIIEMQRAEIQPVKAELQSAKQAERDLRSEAYRTIGALRSKLTLAEKAKKVAEEKLASVTDEKDRLIGEALERSPKYHNDTTPQPRTSSPAIELPSDVRDRMHALDLIAKWEGSFRFLDDDEFNDRAMADIASVLGQPKSRIKLYEFFTEGFLDTWYCLWCVCEHGAHAEGEPRTDHSCCPTHGASRRLVMVTSVDSARHLRFLSLG